MSDRQTLGGPAAKLGSRARGQLMMLSAEFVLGMGVSLLGLPAESSGVAKIATSILLGLHVLLALGLVGLAVLAWRSASELGPPVQTLAAAGAVLVGITFVAGVLTMALDNNWWSFLMAVGFITSLLVYGSLYVRTRTA